MAYLIDLFEPWFQEDRKRAFAACIGTAERVFKLFWWARKYKKSGHLKRNDSHKLSLACWVH